MTLIILYFLFKNSFYCRSFANADFDGAPTANVLEKVQKKRNNNSHGHRLGLYRKMDAI